jgi:hypothetical protein
MYSFMILGVLILSYVGFEGPIYSFMILGVLILSYVDIQLIFMTIKGPYKTI